MTSLNNAARFALGFAALAALVACGGGGASGGSAPPPAPAPVGVQSFAPVDGSTKVDIRQPLTVVFDGAIDANSVTAAHVTLIGKGHVENATLSYDATSHTLSVQPEALMHDTTYTLTLTGLTDANGQVVADKHVAFSTWVNSVTSTPGSDPQYTLDASGHITRVTTNGIGGLSSYVSYTYSSSGQLVKQETWNGAGPDGVWFTADDLREAAVTNTYAENGALLTTTTVRDDRILAHSDDALTTYTYDANGNPSAVTTQLSNGDGVVGTADDIFNYGTYAYDASGHLATIVGSFGKGADGVALTADDIFFLQITTPRTASTPERVSSYDTVGRDGKPFTADDEMLSYLERTYDSRGNVTREVFYNPPAGNPADTFVANFHIDTTYDVHDNIVTRTSYADAGPDGVWLTADDVPSAIATYDTTH